MEINPLLYVDYYKPNHQFMYPAGMTQLYSNLTPRKSRMYGVNAVVTFGVQHFVLEYLIEKFDKNFFFKHARERQTLGMTESRKASFLNDIKSGMIVEYKRHNNVDTSHIEALWDLGFLPIEIKALDEGTLCPIGVPMLTIKISDPAKYGQHAWIVNYLETLMSCMLWQPITSATIAYEYKKLLTKNAIETTGSAEGVQWQGHDFSMRGLSSVESATLSGMGHLTSFTGTDVIPAIYQLESSYSATGLIGASVPATEHSVMCMGQKESEIETFQRLLNLYPTGILSIVSDTWNLWKVCTEYLPQLKEGILARDGKIVIRPDSGNPVDIICGELFTDDGSYLGNDPRLALPGDDSPQNKGVIELLWDVFGGTTNEYGYKVLDSHIGAIYGDSITIDRAASICERLKAKGFASTNIVFGIGSYTYQYNTRDTFGFAVKATYGEITHPDGSVECLEIFKDPITDDGTKKSKKGLLVVTKNQDGSIVCTDQVNKDFESEGLLTTVFKDGKLVKKTTLDEIRERLNNQLNGSTESNKLRAIRD